MSSAFGNKTEITLNPKTAMVDYLISSQQNVNISSEGFHTKAKGGLKDMIRATFKLKLNDLDLEIIKKIKQIFTKDNIIEINVSDDTDEEDYLLSTPANRESLKKSLEQFQKGQFISKHNFL